MPPEYALPPLDYRSAGVDIDAGAALVEIVKPLAAATARPEVLGGIGGFGGLCEVPVGRYRQPVLVAGTDGVGTKLKLATLLGRHETVGIDLVAMCVNDVLVSGAEPLFFLDYYASGALDLDTAAAVLRGIAAGCREAGCALLGGETAEMPGMYARGDYDLAGFCVGIVEKEALLGPERVHPGDALVALASSGPHANGYSLIRQVIARAAADFAQPCGTTTLAEALLAPTRIYVRSVLAARAEFALHAAAHITGGGITENLPRILPPGTRAIIDRATWSPPPVFDWLQRHGQIAAAEMLRTFNLGVGFIIALPESQSAALCAWLAARGEQAWRIGWVEAQAGAPAVIYRGTPP